MASEWIRCATFAAVSFNPSDAVSDFSFMSISRGVGEAPSTAEQMMELPYFRSHCTATFFPVLCIAFGWFHRLFPVSSTRLWIDHAPFPSARQSIPSSRCRAIAPDRLGTADLQVDFLFFPASTTRAVGRSITRCHFDAGVPGNLGRECPQRRR